MADDPAGAEPAESTAAESQVESQAPEIPEVPEGAKNPDAVKRALDAERQAAKEAKKRAEAAEAKVREYEDADKSELEKLQNKLTKTEQRAIEAESTLLRHAVATEKGLSPNLTKFLTGTTKEELEASANELLAELKPTQPPSTFDGGAREAAPEAKNPAEAHRDLLMTVFGRPKQP